MSERFCSELGYDADILFSLDSGKRVAVELKFLSCVSDHFKARSFTVMHVKKQHGNNVYCVLAYVHMMGSVPTPLSIASHTVR